MQSVNAQVQIDIDVSTQRYIGNVSSLDRTKFFTLHSGGGNDADVAKFFKEFNVSPGRGFWSPFAYAKSKTGSVGRYPAFSNSNNTRVRKVNRSVATDHPKNVFRYNLDKNKAANWTVEYYKNVTNDSGRPEFYEPMNEPFIRSGDDVFSSEQPDAQKVRVRMAEWFGAIGKKIDETPELAKMKVIGYASAWPSMELGDFSHWNSRMKMFMDVAGKNIDAFSVHLYDGINVTGQDNKRSGSNSEAILDLMETYSFKKWGVVKPHAITEYGGIEKGYGDNYSKAKSAISIKSINSILFNLLDRENRIAITIPFITPKSTFSLTASNNYQPYTPALWRPLSITPTNNPNKPILGDWTFTEKIKFYKLWSDVKGKRIFVKSNNPDIQTHGFIDDNKVYIALNNLDSKTHKLSLNMLSDISGFQKLKIKSLKIFDNADPKYKVTQNNSMLDAIELIESETVVLEYTFSKALSFNNTLHNTNYYSKKYLQKINKNAEISFVFNNVKTGEGFASLKMAIGRKHNRSKTPVIKVNGTSIDIPSNWKGYDQRNRKDFFGTIDIPFDAELLKTNNTITIKFPDNGGRISSLILSVDRLDKAIIVNPPVDSQLISDGVYTIVSTTSNQRLLSNAQENHNVKMIDPGNNIDQRWVFTHLEDNIYTIKNQKTNRYLEVPFEKCENGENVATGPSVIGDHQKWKIISNGNKIYGFKPLHCQDKGLDRDGGGDGANTIIWNFNKSNKNQKWKVIPAGNRAIEGDITKEDVVRVYPNPAKNMITVKGISSGDRLLVYDILGKVNIHNIADSSEEILNISDLESGLYIISVPGKEKIRFVKK